jgi:hypothetical protein
MQITVAVFVRSILQIKAKRNKWREVCREAPFMPDLGWRTSSRAEHSDRGLLRQ